MIKQKFLKNINIQKALEKERDQKFNLSLKRLLNDLKIKKNNSFNINLLFIKII